MTCGLSGLIRLFLKSAQGLFGVQRAMLFAVSVVATQRKLQARGKLLRDYNRVTN